MKKQIAVLVSALLLGGGAYAQNSVHAMLSADLLSLFHASLTTFNACFFALFLRASIWLCVSFLRSKPPALTDFTTS